MSTNYQTSWIQWVRRDALYSLIIVLKISSLSISAPRENLGRMEIAKAQSVKLQVCYFPLPWDDDIQQLCVRTEEQGKLYFTSKLALRHP